MTILAKGVWVLLVVLVVILLVIPANKSVVAADNIVVTINTPTPTASIIIAPTLTASAFVNNAPILPPTDPKRSD